MSSRPTAGALAVTLALLGAGSAKGDLNVGGDLKFYMADMVTGSSWIPDLDSMGQPITVRNDSTSRIKSGFSSLYLFLMPQFGDRVSFDIEPELDASSGATPRLGTVIGFDPGDGGLLLRLNAAKASVMLPSNIEISAGVMRPMFTEEYGGSRFFHEEYNGGRVSCNPWLAAWHDFGVEVYRPFEMELGKNHYLSLPVYLYLLNGGFDRSADQLDRTVLVHLAPEFGKLRLMGSAAYGRWDPEDKHTVMRYAGGLGLELGRCWLRAEYIGGRWDDQEYWTGESTATMTAKPWGYYVKAGIRVVPDRLQLMLHYDRTHHNFSGFSSIMDTVAEDYTTITGALDFTVVSGSVIILQADKAMWRNGQSDDELDEDEGWTKKLDFLRFTLGWRTVF